MAQEIGNAIDGQLMAAIALSAILALLIVVAVASAWWIGRRWVRQRGHMEWASGIQSSMFRRMDAPRDTRPQADPRPPADSASRVEGPPREEGKAAAEERWTSRLVRDAAERAASFRDTWDRSYRTARETSSNPTRPASDLPLSALVEELLAEQRETNALLRELLSRLSSPD
jgi:hypothetical protein